MGKDRAVRVEARVGQLGLSKDRAVSVGQG